MQKNIGLMPDPRKTHATQKKFVSCKGHFAWVNPLIEALLDPRNAKTDAKGILRESNLLKKLHVRNPRNPRNIYIYMHMCICVG